jgi:hypothetical protein
MAIDTENKRRSVIYILPIPDGIIDADDRRHVAYIYRGISTPVISTSPEERIYQVIAKSRIFNVGSEERVYQVPE